MIDRDLRPGLRLEVHRLRTTTRARQFPAAVHVGLPGAERVTWVEADEVAEVGLRAEVASALLSRALRDDRAGGAWLARVGVPEPHDLDLAWLAPLQRAYAEAGVEPLCLAVVTKTGWYAPWTDETVRWQRLRIR